ncbi:MAG: DUF4136 domain-containing protein [Acidobacteriota bacterium]|nr:DUF4136 domain-containing protein [Acidobacteriota bacterium]
MQQNQPLSFQTPGKVFWLLLAVGLLTLGCGTPIKVAQHHDSDQDFSALKTFDWLPPKGRDNPMEKNPIIAKKVKQAITAELQTKGFTYSESNPDFHVVFFGSTKDKVDVQDWGSPYYGWGYRGWMYGWGGPDVTVTEYKEGTLVIDVVNAGNDQLVWRGYGTKRLSKSDKNIDEGIRKAVTAVMKKFPPK